MFIVSSLEKGACAFLHPYSEVLHLAISVSVLNVWWRKKPQAFLESLLLLNVEVTLSYILGHPASAKVRTSLGGTRQVGTCLSIAGEVS